MDSNDLFSFLEDAPPQPASPPADEDVVMKTEPTTQPKPSAKKRKAATPSSAPQNGASVPEAKDEKEAGPSEPKKPRLDSPKPMVVDEAEIEARREVAASAGLTGGVDAGSKLELRHQVRHQVAVPPGYPYVPIAQHVPPEKPAREYKFTLDPFQQVSVHAIQRNESVLVSAHTSAGKTVVAEYAIAQCLQAKQRVIYTSPIKACNSTFNQKYREMLAEFGDVGLMTGDVTINPSATCLVMTTEILRSMLYRGSEIMREVAWVIFDEIHYMRDKERGVVWEETIILLPTLSDTSSCPPPSRMPCNSRSGYANLTNNHAISSTQTSANSLATLHVPSRGEGIYLVVNEKGEFREDNFTKAMGMLQDRLGDDPADPKAGGKGKKWKTKKGGEKKGPSDIAKIVRMIMLKNYNPVIVFAFSKRECEGLALQMSKLEFNSTEEQDLITSIFTNAMENLSQDDRQLPQISNLLPLLKRGIGIHHGGLLPILKEVIEILFQEGLIKVLFATETFSIGLNMPAKTVVFTSTRKFDGREFRDLSSGEYIQMSGRAGRRGLDDRGVVIMMLDEKLEPTAAKSMIKGEADRLDSAFHLGYNMVLNLMKVEGISPEYMLERCFFQFQNNAEIPVIMAEMEKEEEQEAAIQVEDEELVATYHDYRQQLDQMAADFQEVITHPNYILPFLQPGRLVKVKHQKFDFGWGVIVNYQKRANPKNKAEPKVEDIPAREQYIVDVLLYCTKDSSLPKDRNTTTPTPGGIQPCPSARGGEPLVVPVLLSTVDSISNLRIFMPKDLRPLDARTTTFKTLQEVHARFPDGVPLLDPVKDMKITDGKFTALVAKIDVLERKMFASPLHADARLPALYTAYARKLAHRARARELRRRAQATHDVLQMEELKCRKRVLRRLGFTSAADIVDMKGRVACEISTGDELLLTELVFNGVFNPLSPEQCAALLSCFVFAEKEVARRIAKVSQESKLTINEDDYVKSFKVELMDAVVQWCRGASFSEICKLTDQFEGSLIRVFRRLHELIRQMAQAAKVIGNEELQQKFDKASEMLGRPNSVIFCSSLYL
ncbi:antiviral helicase [Epithele typhae]|uniref:antiviral helicase n=1 Tax=Epithele typhae TaxID=378194 RepID=UPI0020084FF6|nr:antiviral helicase [Epithele typhae]KAH9919459.1 antiviral helicase [Epithele typhae]